MQCIFCWANGTFALLVFSADVFLVLEVSGIFVSFSLRSSCALMCTVPSDNDSNAHMNFYIMGLYGFMNALHVALAVPTGRI